MFRGLIAVLLLIAVGVGSAQSDAEAWEYGTLFLGAENASWFAPGGDVGDVPPNELVQRLQDSFTSARADTEGLLAGILNVLGSAGWELVGMSGDTYVFKRPAEVYLVEMPFLGR